MKPTKYTCPRCGNVGIFDAQGQPKDDEGRMIHPGCADRSPAEQAAKARGYHEESTEERRRRLGFTGPGYTG